MKKWKIQNIFLVCTFIICTVDLYGQADGSLKAQFTFKNLTSDSSQVMDDYGNYTAILENGAKVLKYGNFSVLSLGSADGYLDLGQAMGQVIGTLGDFSISTFIYIDETVD
ncbi:hypothetical protein JW935_26940, partial [candidate division KSB1 bacterium]|nr:hypothetical protein [candidate division KSB1 bacterium]